MQRVDRRPHRGGLARTLLALWIGGLVAAGPAAGRPGGAPGEPLPVENPTFEWAGAHPRAWTFESVSLDYGEEMGRVSPRVEAAGEARLLERGVAPGVALHGATAHARGDLVSAPLTLAPLRWFAVTVEYVVEEGEPLVLACLRPAADRSLVDLAFLRGRSGEEPRRETVHLHTGRTDGAYALALSVVGEGRVRFLSVSAASAGAYAAPDRPVLVVDLMHSSPRQPGEHGWDPVHKLADVFGFSSIAFAHPFEVSPELLERVDPALVVLSPTGEEMLRIDPGTFDIEGYLEGVRRAVEHGPPVVGICAGHHVLAMAHGGRVGAVVEQSGDELRVVEEWGPTELRVLEDDPAFRGLPRLPTFRAVEAHSAVVHSSFTLPRNLASSERCANQVFRYPGGRWYTFQGHIEADWEYACPEGYWIWGNLLREWGLIQDPPG